MDRTTNHSRDRFWRELGLVLAVKALALVLIWWLFFAETVEADLPGRLFGGG